jgi:putative lipoic acid-binding regulatory protein
MHLKVMGAANAPLAELVIDILTRHLGKFDAETQLRESQSSSGNYVSLTAHIVMENKEQVTAIYAELNASPHVKVVF